MAVDWYEEGIKRFYNRPSQYPTRDVSTALDENRYLDGFRFAAITEQAKLYVPEHDE